MQIFTKRTVAHGDVKTTNLYITARANILTLTTASSASGSSIAIMRLDTSRAVKIPQLYTPALEVNNVSRLMQHSSEAQ